MGLSCGWDRKKEDGWLSGIHTVYVLLRLLVRMYKGR